LPGTNTPAYYKNVQITAVKSFIGLAPVVKNGYCQNIAKIILKQVKFLSINNIKHLNC